MNESGNYKRSILSAFLIAAITISPISAFSKPENREKSTEMVEVSIPASKSLQSTYPVLPFLLCAYWAKTHEDTFHGKFAEWVVLAAAFHGATKIKEKIQDLNLTEKEWLAELLSGGLTLALANKAGMANVEGKYLLAASTNQAGMTFKKALNESFSLAQEDSAGAIAHKIDATKTFTAVVTLATIAYFKKSSQMSELSKSDRLAIAAFFTAAYMVRESLIEHFRHLEFTKEYLSAENIAALILSGAGALGLWLTNPGELIAMASTALFEAGAFTATAFLSPWVAAFFGAVLFIPDSKATTTLKAMQATLAGALYGPLAFSVVDNVQDALFSHVVWKK